MRMTSQHVLPSAAVCLMALTLSVGASYTSVQTVVGRTALLPCKVDFAGNPQVMWLDPSNTLLTRGEEVVTGDGRLSVHRPYSNEYNLRIEGVKDGDSGNYTCMIRATPVQRKYVGLLVVSGPVITYRSEDQEVATEGNVTLECQASGTPQPSISWHWESFRGDKIDLRTTGETLALYNVSRQDAGLYECLADNDVPPTASDVIRVDVMFAPIVSTPHQYLSQEAGRDTFLQCTITANPHVTSHWEKDGVVLTNSDKVKVTEQHAQMYNKSLFLFIQDLQPAEFGTYWCVAENQLGKDSQSVQLFEWESGQAKVVTPPEDALSGLHEPVQLNCTVDNMGSGDSLIWWHRSPSSGYRKIFESHPSSADSGPVVLDSDKYDIVGHYNLLVRNVTLEDAGEYLCELSGRRNHTAHITVVEELLCGSNSANQSHLEGGELANFTCTMAFAGPPRLWSAVWTRQDAIKLSSIDEDDVMTVRRTISFPVYAKDSGRYDCEVSSAQTSFRRHCGLEVQVMDVEAPSSPLCDPGRWTGASPTLYIVVAVCVGGTALVFLIVLLVVCRHYRILLRRERASSSPTHNGRNGDIPLESAHLTADSTSDQDV